MIFRNSCYNKLQPTITSNVLLFCQNCVNFCLNLNFKMQIFQKILKKLPKSALLLNVNRKRQFRTLPKGNQQQEHNTPEKLSHETVASRMLLYLTNDNNNLSPLNNEMPLTKAERLLKDIKYNGNNLYTIKLDELLYILNKIVPQQKPRDQNELLKRLNEEFLLRLPEMTKKQMLQILANYTDIVPNRIFKFQIYYSIIDKLSKSVYKLDKNSLLQFMFFVSFFKKSDKSQDVLRKCVDLMNENFINNLTIEELSIICNSTFKTSTKIKNKYLLDRITQCLNNNLFVLNDTVIFITILKSIRYNRLQNEEILATLSCAMLFNQSYRSYTFTDICHILALYADSFYYDERLFSVFMKKCLDNLETFEFGSVDTYSNNNIRSKDIKRFIWIAGMFSDLKLISSEQIEQILVPKIIERIEKKDMDFSSLIDVNLYFWMMNYRPYHLVPYLFHSNNKVKLNGLSPKAKLRLNLLLYSIFIEDEQFYNKLDGKFSQDSQYSSLHQLQNRPLLQRLLKNLQKIRSKLKIHRFEIEQQIPFLNILGITGCKGEDEKWSKSIHIELLDDYTKIQNVEEDLPVGLMSLKIRLLDKSPAGVLVVSENEIDEMTDEELCDYLFDEIKLIC